ncbi:MAG: HPP family protein [Gallionella sp.]|nr:HPP family protein [Gallionella sp.]
MLLKSFKLEPDLITLKEKIKSGLASTAGIFIVYFALQHLPQLHYPTIMLASMAASAVLLYAAHHSPMAQPWPLMGGHFLSAICGWWVVQVIPEPTLAASVGVGLSIFVMSLFRCLHPPGAATALIIVLNYASYRQFGGMWITHVVVLNALMSLIAAIIVNNIVPGRRYPARNIRPANPTSPRKIGLEDIEFALTQMDSVIDVSETDLLAVYELASQHAHRTKS